MCKTVDAENVFPKNGKTEIQGRTALLNEGHFVCPECGNTTFIENVCEKECTRCGYLFDEK